MEQFAYERVTTLPPGHSSPVVPLPVAIETERPLSLAALFEAEESGLLRYATALIGRRTVAEELVQETFLRLHQVWGQVENPKGWLYRSLRNLALNHLRDRPKESELNEESAVTDAKLPDEQLGHDEAIGMVRTLLAEMPPDDRALIQFKYIDNLKYREISDRTGVSVGNVGYRLHFLLKGLADGLRRAGVEGSRG
jgi:RNA polymerase sigma factor (sigma-70 family)